MKTNFNSNQKSCEKRGGYPPMLFARKCSFARIAAMLLMLMTMSVGQMWGEVVWTSDFTEVISGVTQTLGRNTDTWGDAPAWAAPYTKSFNAGGSSSTLTLTFANNLALQKDDEIHIIWGATSNRSISLGINNDTPSQIDNFGNSKYQSKIRDAKYTISSNTSVSSIKVVTNGGGTYFLHISITRGHSRYYFRSDQNSWGGEMMTISEDGLYEYYQVTGSGSATVAFKISEHQSCWFSDEWTAACYGRDHWNYTWSGTNYQNCNDKNKNKNWYDEQSGGNACIYAEKPYYILVYYPRTDKNAGASPIICANNTLPYDGGSSPDPSPLKIYVQGRFGISNGAGNMTYTGSNAGDWSTNSTNIKFTHVDGSIYKLETHRSVAELAANAEGNKQYFHFKEGSTYYGAGSDNVAPGLEGNKKSLSTGNSQNFVFSTGEGNDVVLWLDWENKKFWYSYTDPVQKYTITYAANGGTGSMTDSNSPYAAGTQVTLLSNTFTAPTGKQFASWSVKDASSNTVAVTDGKFIMPSSNVTVTAQWEDEQVVCPETGERFKVVFNNVIDYSLNTTKTAEEEITSSYAAVTNGKVYAGTNKNSDQTVSIKNQGSSMQFYWGSSNTYLKLELDCPLANGDVISFESTTNYELSFGLNTTRVTTPATSSKTYTVTEGDGLKGQEVIYVWRASGSSTYVHSITITRPTDVPTPTTHTITFNCDGATSGCPVDLTNQTALPDPLPEAPFKLAYKFLGWYTNAGKTDAAIAGATISENTTLYAKWSGYMQTQVSLDKNGGTNGSTQFYVPYGSEASAAGFSAPTKAGATFDGYWDGVGGTGTKYFNADGTAAKRWDIEAANVTLYAKWIEVQYAISVDFEAEAKNGNSATDKIEFLNNNHYTISNPTGEISWDNQNGKPSDVGLKIKVNGCTISFWVEANKQVTIKVGTLAGSDNGTALLSLDGGKTFGETLQGAATKSTGTPVVNGPYNTTEPTQFVIKTTSEKWNILQAITIADPVVTHTITYNCDGGATCPEEATEQTNLPNPLPTLTKTGYDFGGWFTNSDKTVAAVAGADLTDAATLYAKWTPTTYTITYENLNGATNSNLTTYTIESETIELVAPGERSGYRFLGWKLTNAEGEAVTSIAHGSTGNMILYATWAVDLTSNWYIKGDKAFLTECAADWEKNEAYRFSKAPGSATSAYIDIEIAQGQLGHTYEFKLQDFGQSGDPMYGWGTNTGDYHTFTATETFGIYNNNGSDHNLKFTPSVLGTYRFKIDWSNGHKLTVTYPVAVTTINLNKTTADVQLGGTVELTATVLPDNAANKNINWSSDNAKFVVSDAGVVSLNGAAIGDHATITATAADGSGVTATCVVTVVCESKWVAEPIAEAVTVSTATTWNWADKLKNKTIELTTNTCPTRNETFIMGNIAGLNDIEGFNAKALTMSGTQYPARTNSSKYFFQGQQISFETTLPGVVSVSYSNTGGSNGTRTLFCNGEKGSVNGGTDGGSSGTDAAANPTIFNVERGPVVLTVQQTGNKEGDTSPMVRIYSITFTPDVTVTFHRNHSNEDETTTTQLIHNNVETALDANAWARTGYVFAGWAESADVTEAAYTNEQAVTFTSDKHLYAVWTPAEYTYKVFGNFTGDFAEYDLTDGAYTAENLVKDRDYEIKIKRTGTDESVTWYTDQNAPSNKMTENNHEGWNFSKEGGTDNNTTFTTAAAGNYVIRVNTSGATPVVTIDYPVSYSVTYQSGDADGGTAVAANVHIASGENQIVSANTWTKTGNRFIGWSDGENTIQPGATIENITENITLTAQWETVVTSIAISAEGGETEVMATATLQLYVAYTPSDAAYGRENTTWTTSNINRATVSNTGLVTGVAAGPVTITARTENGVVAEYNLTVTAAPCGDGIWTLTYWATGGKKAQRCFSKLLPEDDSNHEWRTEEVTLPNEADWFSVGQVGGANTYSRDWTFSGLTTIGLQSNNEATNRYPGQDAIGYLRIFDNSTSENYYVAFEPTYVLKYYNGVSDWAMAEFSYTGRAHEYETGLVLAPAGYFSDDTNYKYYVGTKRANGRSEFVSNKSETLALNTMTGLSASDRGGKYGKFHIWDNSNSNNWYCEFASYMTYVLKNDDESIFYLAPGVISTTPEGEGRKTTFYTGVPEKTGYTCIGWNHEKGAATTEIVGGGDYNYYTGNDTRYPVWQANTYNIIYKDKDDAEFSGSFASEYPESYTYGTATTLVNPTKTGYTFDGWYTDQACETGLVTSLAADGYTADITLYAKWTAKTYTISYKDQGNVAYSGSNSAALPTSHTYGIPTTLVDGVREGYTFQGWYGGSDCTGTVWTVINSEREISGNTTFYAKWTKDPVAPVVTWTVDETVYAGGKYAVSVTTTSDATLAAGDLTVSSNGELTNKAVDGQTITATLIVPTNATVAPTLSLHTAATANYTESTDTKDDITLGDCSGNAEETYFSLEIKDDVADITDIVSGGTLSLTSTHANIIGGNVLLKNTDSQSNGKIQIKSDEIYFYGNQAYVKISLSNEKVLEAGDVLYFEETQNRDGRTLWFNTSDTRPNSTPTAVSTFSTTQSPYSASYIVVADDGIEGTSEFYIWRSGSSTYIKSMTITRPATGPGKQTANLAWNTPAPEATVNKTFGNADFTYSASSDNCAGEVTYSSSDEAVATVAADGTVHILKAGTTTITATVAKDGYGCFSEKSLSYTLEVAPLNLVISSGTTVISNDAAYSKITVQGGATLAVTNNATLNVGELYLTGGLLDGGGYDVPRVYVENGSTLNKTNPIVYLDLSINTDNWYPLAVPFPVKINGTEGTEANMLNYKVRYAEEGNNFAGDLNQYAQYRTDGNGQVIIKTYDGEHRAATAVDHDNWKGIAYNGTLTPGIGYIIKAVPVDGKAVIRFEMNTSTPATNQVAVTAWGKDVQGLADNHKGWNMLGVPYMSCFGSADWKDNEGLLTGSYAVEEGKVVIGNKETRYVTVPAYDFSEYIQTRVADAQLLPEWSFFIQAANSGTLTFAANRQAQSPLRVSEESGEEELETAIVLSHGAKRDKTGLILHSDYSANYEIGADLEKMFGDGFTLSTYTVMNGTRLAFNAMDEATAAQTIPVGYRAPEAGEYTFSLDPRFNTEGIERIDLIDYETGVLTNLLYGDYTFTTGRMQTDTRFALNVTLTHKVPTGVDNTEGAGGRVVEKVVIDDIMYIIVDGKMYDATGKAVK